MDSIWCRDVVNERLNKIDEDIDIVDLRQLVNDERVDFEQLDGDINTDVLIIGGGIAGVLCAHALKEAGVDCTLVEAKSIGSGITKNTTAKITLGHGLIYDKLISKYGEEKARMYLEAQLHALDQYEQLCMQPHDNSNDEGSADSYIDCDYEKKDNYVYSLDDPEKIRREVAALRRLGVDAEFCGTTELPFTVAGAVRVKDQAQFHPLKFLYGIAKDLPIYENTKVLDLKPEKTDKRRAIIVENRVSSMSDKWQAVTNRGTITCKKIIIATHFPILNKHGLYPLKMYQHRSYVIALKNRNINGMYVDESDTGLSFRNYGDLLLLGGGSHRTGKKGGGWQELERFAGKYYKDAEIVGRWATQDCMTLDRVPYIGHYGRGTPDLYVATGFNKWGMTNSMVAANVICDMIVGRYNPWRKVFEPARRMMHPQLAVNVWDSAVGLMTPTTPRCPHLGCALKYNSTEHSWDCPCHGSRFTEEGELIDNPATDDMKK